MEKLGFTMVDFPSGATFVAYQMDLAGPMAQVFSRVPEAKRSAVVAEMAREAEQVGGIPVRLLGMTWVASGHA